MKSIVNQNYGQKWLSLTRRVWDGLAQTEQSEAMPRTSGMRRRLKVERRANELGKGHI